jgi:hypothetical protein
MKTIINADVGILLRTGVKNKMIDCLCVFIYYIFYVLLIYVSLSIKKTINDIKRDKQKKERGEEWRTIFGQTMSANSILTMHFPK